MMPAAKAAGDALWFNTAGLRHVVTTLPQGGLDEAIAGGQWNTREVLAHVTAYLTLQATVVERVVTDAAPFPEGFSVEQFHESTPDGGAIGVSTNLPDLLEAVAAGRNKLSTAMESLTTAHLGIPFRGATIADAIRRWPDHIAVHGLHIVATFPEFHIDPFVLNWLLPIPFEHEDEQGHQDAIRKSGKSLLEQIEAADRE